MIKELANIYLKSNFRFEHRSEAFDRNESVLTFHSFKLFKSHFALS